MENRPELVPIRFLPARVTSSAGPMGSSSCAHPSRFVLTHGVWANIWNGGRQRNPVRFFWLSGKPKHGARSHGLKRGRSFTPSQLRCSSEEFQPSVRSPFFPTIRSNTHSLPLRRCTSECRLRQFPPHIH